MSRKSPWYRGSGKMMTLSILVAVGIIGGSAATYGSTQAFVDIDINDLKNFLPNGWWSETENALKSQPQNAGQRASAAPASAPVDAMPQAEDTAQREWPTGTSTLPPSDIPPQPAPSVMHDSPTQPPMEPTVINGGDWNNKNDASFTISPIQEGGTEPTAVDGNREDRRLNSMWVCQCQCRRNVPGNEGAVWAHGTLYRNFAAHPGMDCAPANGTTCSGVYYSERRSHPSGGELESCQLRFFQDEAVSI